MLAVVVSAVILGERDSKLPLITLKSAETSENTECWKVSSVADALSCGAGGSFC